MANASFVANRSRIVLLVAALCIVIGGAAFFYGEWSVGIGTLGVANRLIAYCGMALVGIGAFAIAVVFAKNMVSTFVDETSVNRRESLKSLGRQSLAAVLNVLVYGGLLILALGCISALDSTNPVTVAIVIFILAICVIVFILFRRYKKSHPSRYDLVGTLGMILFMFILGIAMLIGFSLNARGAVMDLVEGPRTADVFLVDASIDRPSWRYRSVVQDHHVLTFYTADEERIVLEVPEADIANAKTINDLGNFVHLTYFPNSQVFVSATEWQDGRQAMGEELLNRLHDTYDFIM